MRLPALHIYIPFAGLALLWLLIQVFFLLKSGTQTAVDSEFYIADATTLLAGNWPGGRSLWYISYSFFLAAIYFLGGTNTFIVFVQMLLSGLAAIGLYHISLHLFKNQTTAFLTVLFYLLWVKIHEWNTFLYTESLFTSCCILSFAALLKCKKVWQYSLTLSLLVFTFFIRPTGFALLLGVGCYVVMSVTDSFYKRSLFVIIVGIFSVVVLTQMLASFTLIDSYSKAELIYPDITLGLVVPSDLYIPQKDISALERLLSFASHNPVYFGKLFALKLLLFVGNVKPYFSVAHNTLIVIFLYPLYFFAIRGWLRFPSHPAARYFILCFCLVQVLTVALTSENWDGRFLIPVLPFVFILSANGIVSTFRQAPLTKA